MTTVNIEVVIDQVDMMPNRDVHESHGFFTRNSLSYDIQDNH